jgi:hypothetical protein
VLVYERIRVNTSEMTSFFGQKDGVGKLIGAEWMENLTFRWWKVKVNV